MGLSCTPNFLFCWTTLQIHHLKYIFHSFSGRTYVLRFKYFPLFQYFHHTYFCEFLRSCVILYNLWTFDLTYLLFMEAIFISSVFCTPRFLLSIKYRKLRVIVMFPFWKNCFCAIYFLSAMLIVHLYNFM